MGANSRMAGDPVNRDWRFKCGVALFGLKILLMLLVPSIALSGLPTAQIAGITGALVVSNKILFFLLVAILGKAGFRELKRILGAHLPRLRRDEIVGPTRHAIGVVMFFLPLASSMFG